MRERLEQIRQLLSDLESEMEAGSTSTADRDFSALELPGIIQEIVDDLQPLLTPYEAAFYWYAFRHSIAKDGNPHVRLGNQNWLPGMDSNHELDRILMSHNLLILQSR
jgi:hypothetical protein